MRPGIEDGSHVLINTLAYDFRFGALQVARAPVHRGDVVAFRRQSADGEKIYLKRVIGLPGDELAIKDGTIYVNGGALNEAYPTVSDGGSLTEQRVPAGGVFVVGDNRAESDDSRSFGPVLTSSILGKAVLTIWPLSRVSPIR